MSFGLVILFCLFASRRQTTANVWYAVLWISRNVYSFHIHLLAAWNNLFKSFAPADGEHMIRFFGFCFGRGIMC